jgi:hypothetical protein
MMTSRTFHFLKRHIFTRLSLLEIMRRWLEALEIHNPKVAKLLCKIVPSRCPFERDIKFFSHTVFHIPSLCKLNPLYEQLISLRFRCLSYLADECGEDIASYC